MSMTEQEVFDTVKKHLLTQNKKAKNGSGAICLYRTPNGLKCAIGCMIPDDKYVSRMEDTSVHILLFMYPGLPFANVDKKFLVSLQDIHDYKHNKVEDWPRLLEEFAIEHNLTF